MFRLLGRQATSKASPRVLLGSFGDRLTEASLCQCSGVASERRGRADRLSAHPASTGRGETCRASAVQLSMKKGRLSSVASVGTNHLRLETVAAVAVRNLVRTT